MLIGSDQRAKDSRDYQGTDARSDTMILIRLDPSKKATALLSIPRDLKVAIPGHGVGKINAAYSYGGAKLTLETMKQLTGLRINHVINVDFRGFVNAVNRLGCVYIDIDRRYLQQPGGDGYAAIDLQPGYQRLCGRNALSYVRFRHTDTDIVRAARQQQLPRADEAAGRHRQALRRARTSCSTSSASHTRPDIRSQAAVLRLLKLALASAGHPIQEVQVRGVNRSARGELRTVAPDRRCTRWPRVHRGAAIASSNAGEARRPKEAPPRGTRPGRASA